MARSKRMFSCDVVDTDKFLDMPVSARCLYYDLGMRADDDGFISPKKVLRLTGASDDDLRVLIARDFVIPFESGVIVIKDWKLNNYLRKDRYFPTKYTEEKSKLSLLENGSYAIGEVMDTVGVPHGIPLGAPRREEKRKEKESIDRPENIDTSMNTSIDTTHNPKLITNNTEILMDKKNIVNTVEILSREDTILELSKVLDLNQDIVREEVEKMIDWLKAKGKRYKDYKAFARNWLRRVKIEKKDSDTNIKFFNKEL